MGKPMYHVCAFYQFTAFPDPDGLRPRLHEVCALYEIVGTILVAREGINGTVAALSKARIEAILGYIRGLPGCAEMAHKSSTASAPPFKRMKVRLKREIVAMGQPDIEPSVRVGDYVEPKDWDALSAEEDVVLIDTRNDYEVAIGSFDGAINPQTTRFGEFPRWWQENKDRFTGKRVAMFCTGGIRCEKSTNYLLSQGVREVYHLKGGILKYLEKIAPEQSSWKGECYVFDGRVSLGHGLGEGRYQICYACGRPLAPEDLKDVDYVPGVQCHKCRDEYSEADRARFRERQRQLEGRKSGKIKAALS